MGVNKWEQPTGGDLGLGMVLQRKERGKREEQERKEEGDREEKERRGEAGKGKEGRGKGGEGVCGPLGGFHGCFGCP